MPWQLAVPPAAACHTCCCLLNAAEAVNTGPLEATIVSLSRDIDAKSAESRDLQRRWLAKQTELVALQVARGLGRPLC
jgi:hypothetical protein